MVLGFEDKLVSNLENFKLIESRETNEYYTEGEFYESLLKRVEICTVLINENKDILDIKLRPMLKGAGSLPCETVDSLFELSLRLYSYSNPLDMGISLEILEGITQWARDHEDKDRLIKYLYHAGFIYQQLNDRLIRYGLDIFKSKCRDKFYEAASYTKDYFNIESKQTRSYINRCLGNLYVICLNPSLSEPEEINAGVESFFANVDTALEFWNSKKVREFDPDMPWDQYVINSMQNTSSWIWMLSRHKHQLNDVELVRRVSKSCKFLLEQEKSSFLNDFWSSLQTEYAEFASKYCLDEISYAEMLDKVRAMFSATDINDYSNEGIYANLSIPIDLIRLFRAEDLEKVSFKDEVKQIVQRMHKFCKNFPVTGNKTLFARHMGTACKTMVEILDFDESVELILSLTAYTHLPTYAHSMMIQGLSKVMTNHILPSKPEYFIGICGASTASEVITKRQEIVELIGHAALCHDVGKILYLDKVAIFSRKLYDIEFDIIKGHANSDSLIKAIGDKMQLVVDVIAGHHKWHDNSRGYNEKFDATSTEFKSAINIITVADSIDAATDGIGRYYSNVLTLEAVINEIHEQAGSRYCPVISEALKDPALVAKLRECITAGRKRAYYKAYLKMRSG